MLNTCDIRIMEAADLPLVLAWRNHPEVRRYMLTQHEVSASEHQNWFANASQDPTRQLLIVEEKGIPIGYVQFSKVAMGGVANWGFYTYPNAPKGTGQKLGSAALNHAFFKLHLHKVCGQALAFNINSIAFHQRLGFTQEGILRDQYCIQGKYHPLVCFGLLQNEWTKT